MTWPFTKQQTIGAGILAVLIAVFVTKRKPLANVGFEAPTVWGEGSGSFGGTGFDVGYGVPHSDSRMDELIAQSNALGTTVVRDGRNGLMADE